MGATLTIDTLCSTDIWRLVRDGEISALVNELDRKPDRCNEKDGDGRTPLYYACLHRNEDAAVILIERGAIVDIWQLARDGMTSALETALKKEPHRLEEKGGPRNETLIYYACKNNRNDTCVMLIKHGAKADIWQLARDDKREILGAALDQDISRIDEKGGSRNESALWYAFKNNRLDCALMLIEKGAESMSTDQMQQVLLYAIDKEKYDLVKMLFIRGAQPDIFEMARTGRTAVVNILLDLQPSRLTEKDSRGCTILDYAYENNHDETAIALVAKGATADTWQLSREGKTVILSAALNKAYYRLDEKDGKGCTPLCYACATKNWDTALMLIEMGADSLTLDSSFKTPFDYIRGAADLQRMQDAVRERTSAMELGLLVSQYRKYLNLIQKLQITYNLDGEGDDNVASILRISTSAATLSSTYGYCDAKAGTTEEMEASYKDLINNICELYNVVIDRLKISGAMACASTVLQLWKSLQQLLKSSIMELHQGLIVVLNLVAVEVVKAFCEFVKCMGNKYVEYMGLNNVDLAEQCHTSTSKLFGILKDVVEGASGANQVEGIQSALRCAVEATKSRLNSRSDGSSPSFVEVETLTSAIIKLEAILHIVGSPTARFSKDKSVFKRRPYPLPNTDIVLRNQRGDKSQHNTLIYGLGNSIDSTDTCSRLDDGSYQYGRYGDDMNTVDDDEGSISSISNVSEAEQAEDDVYETDDLSSFAPRADAVSPRTPSSTSAAIGTGKGNITGHGGTQQQGNDGGSVNGSITSSIGGVGSLGSAALRWMSGGKSMNKILGGTAAPTIDETASSSREQTSHSNNATSPLLGQQSSTANSIDLTNKSSVSISSDTTPVKSRVSAMLGAIWFTQSPALGKGDDGNAMNTSAQKVDSSNTDLNTNNDKSTIISHYSHNSTDGCNKSQIDQVDCENDHDYAATTESTQSTNLRRGQIEENKVPYTRGTGLLTDIDVASRGANTSGSGSGSSEPGVGRHLLRNAGSSSTGLPTPPFYKSSSRTSSSSGNNSSSGNYVKSKSGRPRNSLTSYSCDVVDVRNIGSPKLKCKETSIKDKTTHVSTAERRRSFKTSTSSTAEFGTGSLEGWNLKKAGRPTRQEESEVDNETPSTKLLPEPRLYTSSSKTEDDDSCDENLVTL